MPKTTKLTEYEQFKKALQALDSDPKLEYVEFGDYVVMSKKKIIETANLIANQEVLKRHIFGKAN